MIFSISKTITRMWDMVKFRSELPTEAAEPLIKKPNVRKDTNLDADKKKQLSQVIYGI
jgi:hypothetical protein